MTQDPITGNRKLPRRRIRLRKSDRTAEQQERIRQHRTPKPKPAPPKPKDLPPRRTAPPQETVIPVVPGVSPGKLSAEPSDTLPLMLPAGTALSMTQQEPTSQRVFSIGNPDPITIQGRIPPLEVTLTVPAAACAAWLSDLFGPVHSAPKDLDFFIEWEGLDEKVGPLWLTSTEFQEFASAPDARVFRFFRKT